MRTCDMKLYHSFGMNPRLVRMFLHEKGLKLDSVPVDLLTAAAAEAVAAALGIEAPERREGPNPDDLVDLTVVVGADLADAYGLEAAAGPPTRGDDAG
jgi:hypothetical protein